MTFAFDGDPQVRAVRCERCGDAHTAVTGFVLRDGDAVAVYGARWYPHIEEAYLDVVLGPFDDDERSDERVTFGCRVGRVASQREPAASLVAAGSTLSDSPMWGTRLDRPAALEHRWLPTFWAIVDWLIVNDPTLHEHVYHLPAEGP